MKAYSTYSNRLLSFFVIFSCTLIFCNASQLPSRCFLYAQTYQTSVEDSKAVREAAPNSPSNVLSEFFLGKRNVGTRSRFAFTPSNSPNGETNSVSRQNSDYNATLKKFFGLTPRKGASMTKNDNVHADSFPQGLPIEEANLGQIVNHAETSSEQLVNGLRRASDEAVHELDTVRHQTERRIEATSRSVDKTVQDLQNHGRRYAHGVQNQFQGAQKTIEKNAFDVGRQGREIVRETRDAISREVDDMINVTSDGVRKFRRETTNLLPPAPQNGVDATLQENRQRIAKSRRQRLEELNAILAERRPEERVLRERKDRLQDIRGESNVAQVNRSTIRQASNIEPKTNLKKRSVSKRRLQESVGRELSKPVMNIQDFGPPATTGFQDSVARSKKSRAFFVEPSESVEEGKGECSTNDCNGPTTASNKPHDVIKNGVIRSSAKFIDPKDL